MGPIDAINSILRERGYSGAKVSRALGRNPGYVSHLFGIMPKVDTFVSILDACDYDLVARSRDDSTEFIIDNYVDPTIDP